MFLSKNDEQTILDISQGDYINATADSFLIDRQARELSRHTLRFYREFLRTFIEYCNANSKTFIQEITADFLRRYFLAFGEKHNPGGVHGAYRTLRAFFQWLVKEEVMPPDWKNPMLKVKAPKVVLDPLEPISIQDQGFDLGMIAPLLLSTGIRLWRRSAWGYLLAGVSLSYSMPMCITLPAFIAVPLIQDGKIKLIEASPLLILCLLGLILACLFFKNV